MQEVSLFEVKSLSTIKQELKPFCYKGNKTIRSYQQFFKLYYYIRLLKYSTQEQLKNIGFPGGEKVCTTNMLNSLVKLGHISVTGNDKDIYIPNETTDIIVKSVKYSGINYFKHFANLPTGKDALNEIKNTSVFVEALRLPNYYYLLFPDFEYLIPDALLVLKEEDRYKLIFLEIETKQSNWEQRLERMRNNYLRLATDKQVYEYWQKTAGYISLAVPSINEFKFSVNIITSINKQWGDGFEFKERLFEH